MRINYNGVCAFTGRSTCPPTHTPSSFFLMLYIYFVALRLDNPLFASLYKIAMKSAQYFLHFAHNAQIESKGKAFVV
jgi:hypothetical protein